MKKINKYIAAIVAGVMFTGCNELDLQPYGSTVTSEQKSEVVKLEPGKALASVSGISGMMTAFGSVLGTDNQSDIGFPALFIMMDQRGQDMYSINTGYNWYLSAMRMSDGLPTSNDTYSVWAYNYKMIRACNDVLQTVLPTIDPNAVDEAALELKFYAGQAYAFRAFAYTYLVNSYQFTYKGHENALAVPILTESNQVEAAENGAPRAAVKDVYAQILSDLDNAIALLEGNPVTADKVIDNKPKRFISAAAAYGLRARANLCMTKWAEAAADAQKAITLFGAAPLSMAEASAPGFNDISAHNWMWGIAVAETDRVVTTGICNFPSHMGSFSYGYATAVGAWKWINKNLYTSIPASDVRKGWWLDDSGLSANLTATQQSYLSARGASSGVQVKFAPYNDEVGTSVNASDIPLMRVEEMYLILAEAQGMTSVATGKTTLENFVKTYRDQTYSCSAANSAEFQDEVWHQRRIELWGEGFSYYDMLRLGKPLDRVGGGWPAEVTYKLAADDKVLVFPIPYEEINANKAMTEAENTNGGGQPTPYTGN